MKVIFGGPVDPSLLQGYPNSSAKFLRKQIVMTTHRSSETRHVHRMYCGVYGFAITKPLLFQKLLCSQVVM